MTALIWSVFSSPDEAREIARSLLEEKLVGCANIVGGIESLFVWNGAIDQAKECGCLFKTDAKLLKAATNRLEQLHPYETPAILGWTCDEAGDATRTWLEELAGNRTSQEHKQA